VTTLTDMSDAHTEVQSAYPPAPEFAAQANATEDLVGEAQADRLAFWAKQANRLSWDTPFTEVLDWSGAPFAKWFVGGRLNVAYNCVDRHVEAGNGDRVAIRWEGEPGDSRELTYADLLAVVSKAANALTELGLVAGDRVAIYMPMVPEAIVAMLACARLGVLHSVVFAGFSASALAARIEDAEAKLVITTDGQFRRGQAVSLKEAVDEAVDGEKARSSMFWWCAAPELTRPGPRAAICGGMRPSRWRRPNTRQKPSTPSTRCFCSTRRVPRASPRASCTPPAAI
jgi:acetyl-CoA synthetase